MVRSGVVALAVALLLVGCGDGETRRDVVARRGASVMPFDLDATTHIFQPTADGGVQTVVADDLDARSEVESIREHLSEEATRFQQGDFDDPAEIHGDDMPGLATLRSGYGAIEVSYSEVAMGARIEYTTDRADLVDALHAWFDSQVDDHGEHAQHGVNN